MDSFGSDEGRVGISGGKIFFALLGCCFSLVWLQHCITIELVFTLNLRVCLSDDSFRSLYSIFFAAVNKYHKLTGVLQMHFLSFVCCSLLEMMLESSLSDLRDSQGVSLPHLPSLLRLLRLLQDFLFAEGTDNQTLWSEKVGNGWMCSHFESITRTTLISKQGEFETGS